MTSDDRATSPKPEATPTPQQRAEACLAAVHAAMAQFDCDIAAVIERIDPVGRGAHPPTVLVSAGWRVVAN